MENKLVASVRTADWKTEKHAPSISAPKIAKAGETIAVELAVGKELPHPNSVEHHIEWLALHYVPDGSTTSIELARFDLRAHGQAPRPNEGPARTLPNAVAFVQLDRGGELHATAYCNIHGLWTSSVPIKVI